MKKISWKNSLTLKWTIIGSLVVLLLVLGAIPIAWKLALWIISSFG